MSDTRKVVINDRHGGYGLSWAAMQALAKRKGLVASYFPMNPDIRRKVYGDTRVDPNETFVHIVVGPRAISSYAGMTDGEFKSDDDYPRDDPDVVAVVEELGSETASSSLAALKVVEIPADVEWKIEEYDGSEWVAEVHRTWS